MGSNVELDHILVVGNTASANYADAVVSVVNVDFQALKSDFVAKIPP